MGFKKAQAGIEAMVALAILTGFFIIVIAAYSLQMGAVGQISRVMAAQNICHMISLSIDAISQGPSSASMIITLPALAGGENYTARIFPSQRYVRVDIANATYRGQLEGAGCGVRTQNITNASGGSSIVLGENVSINYTGGVVRIG